MAEIKRRQVKTWSTWWKDEIHGDRLLEATEWANGEGVTVHTGDPGSRLDLCFEDIPHMRRLLKAILEDAGYRRKDDRDGIR